MWKFSRDESVSTRKRERRICYVVTLILILLKATQGLEETDCEIQRIVQKNPVKIVFPKDPQPPLGDSSAPFNRTIWIKPSEAELEKNKIISLKFGRLRSHDTVVDEYEMFFKTNKKMQYNLKSLLQVPKLVYMDGRIPIEWLNKENWSRISITDSKFTWQFKDGSRILDIHLDGIKFWSVDVVTISSGINMIASVNCTPFQEQTTTAAATPSMIPETSPLPEVTENEITTIPDFETSEFVTELIDVDSVTEGDEMNSTYGLKESMSIQECSKTPSWVWGCIGVMLFFVILSVVLFIYVLILHRRCQNTTNLGKQHTTVDRLNSHGGFGQQVDDMQFVEPNLKDGNVLVVPSQPTPSSYSQTMHLMRGNQMPPDVQFHTAPRNKDYRRSTSCPGPHDRSPSINFPAPPSTPPPERLPERVPLFSPDGSYPNEGRHSRGHLP